MAKNKPKVYNDGICRIVSEEKASSSFNARQNGNKTSDFKECYKLMFAETSVREQDLEFAETIGRSLNRKIKTHFLKNVVATKKIIIENTLYDIVNIDFDRVNDEMYFYLEEVRNLV